MARVQGIIAAGLASGRNTTAETAAPAAAVREVAPDSNALLTQIRARQERLNDANSTAPNAELAARSGLAGLGAASVFGPAGLLVGGLVQFFGRRRQRNMEELATQDAEATTAAVERTRSTLQDARANAQTDEERAEVDMHMAQFEQLEGLTYHPDANVRAQALIKMLDVSGTLDTELEEVEERRLEAEARDRERFEYEVGRADDIRGELVTEVGKDWLTRMQAYQSMLAVEPGSMGDLTLIIRAMKVNDPNSAVLPGEAANAAQLGGVPDGLVTLYNRVLRDGERLDQAQREDIIRQSGLILRENMGNVIDANSSAAERLRAQGVRDELITSTLLPLPDFDKLPLPTSQGISNAARGALSGPTEAAPPQPGQPGQPIAFDDVPRNAEEVTPSLITRGLGTIARGAQSYAGEVGRLMRGEKLMQTPDGRQFIQSESGEMREIQPQRFYEQEDGSVLELIDHGEGRREWRTVRPPNEQPERGLGRGPYRGTIDRSSNAD